MSLSERYKRIPGFRKAINEFCWHGVFSFTVINIWRGGVTGGEITHVGRWPSFMGRWAKWLSSVTHRRWDMEKGEREMSVLWWVLPCLSKQAIEYCARLNEVHGSTGNALVSAPICKPVPEWMAYRIAGSSTPFTRSECPRGCSAWNSTQTFHPSAWRIVEKRKQMSPLNENGWSNLRERGKKHTCHKSSNGSVY